MKRTLWLLAVLLILTLTVCSCRSAENPPAGETSHTETEDQVTDPVPETTDPQDPVPDPDPDPDPGQDPDLDPEQKPNYAKYDGVNASDGEYTKRY